MQVSNSDSLCFGLPLTIIYNICSGPFAITRQQLEQFCKDFKKGKAKICAAFPKTSLSDTLSYAAQMATIVGGAGHDATKVLREMRSKCLSTPVLSAAVRYLAVSGVVTIENSGVSIDGLRFFCGPISITQHDIEVLKKGGSLFFRFPLYP